MSDQTAEAPPATPRPRPAPTRRLSKGNLWGILQGRLYVPLGDLRRQFQIDSDDVTAVSTPEGTFYVGLPAESAAVLGQLWHEGRITFDCTPDLRALVVRAIVPTRPTRPPPSRTPVAGRTAPRPAPVVLADPATADRNGPRPPVAPGAPIDPGAPLPPVGPRRVGIGTGDEFLPVPETDAFAADAPENGAGRAPAAPMRDRSSRPPSGAGRAPAAAPGPAGRPGPGGAPVVPTVREPEAGTGEVPDDEGARRRRRGGIGRATRLR